MPVSLIKYDWLDVFILKVRLGLNGICWRWTILWVSERNNITACKYSGEVSLKMIENLFKKLLGVDFKNI